MSTIVTLENTTGLVLSQVGFDYSSDEATSEAVATNVQPEAKLGLRSSGGKNSQSFCVGVVFNNVIYQVSLNQDHIPGTMVNQTTPVELQFVQNKFQISLNGSTRGLSEGSWPFEVNLL